jgi:hypothetical protein
MRRQRCVIDLAEPLPSDSLTQFPCLSLPTLLTSSRAGTSIPRSLRRTPTSKPSSSEHCPCRLSLLCLPLVTEYPLPLCLFSLAIEHPSPLSFFLSLSLSLSLSVCVSQSLFASVGLCIATASACAAHRNTAHRNTIPIFQRASEIVVAWNIDISQSVFLFRAVGCESTLSGSFHRNPVGVSATLVFAASSDPPRCP